MDQINRKDKDFWTLKKEFRFFNITIFQIKKSLYTEKFLFFGIKLFEKTFNEQYDYKRKRLKILGTSFTYKTKSWLKQSSIKNIKYNKLNLSKQKGDGNKNILFIASNFVKTGGIETRLLQYINQITSSGWNCYLLSENNENESLNKLTNFHLNFDAENFHTCLNNIIENYNINVVEFQFKNPKILKNLNLDILKSKVKLGCVIHNTGISDFNIINKFDYKIMVSKLMYEENYLQIKNVEIIRNCIDTREYNNKKTWTYNGQKTAMLISRIDTDKLNSINCFIEYCKKNNIDFLIAGEENTSKKIKKELINRYKLSESVFIGKINTIDYLSKNVDNILFVAGLGLVILEALYLNYPCFCCSNMKHKNYSFITEKNINLFDNFTVYKNGLVSKMNKKEFYINTNKINEYQLRQYIIDNRNLEICTEKYLNIIENKR